MEQIRSPLVARRLLAESRSVVIHADSAVIDAIRASEYSFFNRLVPYLTGLGLSTRMVEIGGSASRVLMDADSVDIIVGDHPGYGRNRLHVAQSYIWGFWYLDEVGVNWNSSLRFARFDPAQINAEQAAYFFNGVTGHMLRENVSKITQEPRQTDPMERAAAVVFCQMTETAEDRSHYLTTEDMIRTAATACRPDLVYVKMHPDQCKHSRRQIMATCADYTNVRISDASIHDLADAARVVVTQNSAAGFEALMQRKPVITCAKSDYWHATLTPRTTQDLSEAITYGQDAMAGFDFAKYLYWFLDRNCLEPQKDVFAKRAWARIKDKAFY